MLRRLSLILALILVSAACSGTSSTAETSTASTPLTTVATTTSEATTPADPTTLPPLERGSCDSVSSGVHSATIGDGQIMSVLVPSSFSGAALPVVLNFHGLGSDGFQEAALTGYNALGEREGFIVAHPNGRPAPGDTRNTWELAQFDISDRDDVALVGEIIDTLIQDFCGDPARVYSTGMSNGGLFTSYLVCELADRIAATVSVAGVTHHDECTPARPVPMMAFHGTADKIVPFGGGISSLPGGDDEFFQQVMLDEFAEFATDFNCDAEPNRTDVSVTVIRYDYDGCDDGVPMVFFEIVGGGHTWPSSILGPLLEDVMGPTNYEVDATVDGWQFMSQFSLND